MDDRRQGPWRGLPISEIAFAIALIMAIGGLVSMHSEAGRWAMMGAMVVALLAGIEMQWRERTQNRPQQPGKEPPEEL